MRTFITALLLLLPIGALADNSIGQCPVVEERSHSRISCSLSTLRIYQLNYHNQLTYRAVKWSGRYSDLIDSLCQEGRTVIESTDKQQLNIIRCEEWNR
jgi:hypothetical protein